LPQDDQHGTWTSLAYQKLGYASRASGRLAEALTAFEIAWSLGRNPTDLATIGLAQQAAASDRDRAVATRNQLLLQSQQRYVSPLDIAMV
jgi:hypothetical protein